MKKILLLLFALLFGMSFLAVVSPTTVTRIIPIGNEMVSVAVSVGDSVPLATGEEAIVQSIRNGSHVTVRIIGGITATLQVSAISLRSLYWRRKKAEKEKKTTLE
jgi:preprotein translocase subunit YajC